ncbi:MAG: phosphopyruvate hydratase [Candidatus Woesearchaeota archaeon]
MTSISNIKAREILDSRGHPTIEVTVFVNNITGTAAVPSGASTGVHEALELRDHKKPYLGQGVQKALHNIEHKIKPLLLGIDVTRQSEIDSLMIQRDNTSNKRKLGANAILAVSLACAVTAATVKNLYLYEHINELLLLDKEPKIPQCFFNIINGGKHADNRLSFQEFMVSPKFNSIRKNIQAASEIYHYLKKDLHNKYGKGTTNVGDEGGFAPEKMHKAEDALDMLQKAIKDAGYKQKDIGIAMDCAASEFYKKKKYLVDNKTLTKEKLLEYYLKLVKKYKNIISIEDPFEQEDFKSFAKLKQSLQKQGSKVQVVGDDLTVTNLERIECAIRDDSCNCLLLKVNQIGTLTEALDAVRLAYENGWKVMVSHRSGETEDTFIADLAVGIGCGQMKSGAPCRGERTAKYNRLLRIQELMDMD